MERSANFLPRHYIINNYSNMADHFLDHHDKPSTHFRGSLSPIRPLLPPFLLHSRPSLTYLHPPPPPIRRRRPLEKTYNCSNLGFRLTFAGPYPRLSPITPTIPSTFPFLLHSRPSLTYLHPPPYAWPTTYQHAKPSLLDYPLCLFLHHSFYLPDHPNHGKRRGARRFHVRLILPPTPYLHHLLTFKRRRGGPEVTRTLIPTLAKPRTT